MKQPRITPARLVALEFGAAPTADDVKAIVATVRDHWNLTHNLAELADRFDAQIVLSSGDEVELTPEAVDQHLSHYAERCQEASDQAYYGGDSPGFYGPDDPGPGGR